MRDEPLTERLRERLLELASLFKTRFNVRHKTLQYILTLLRGFRVKIANFLRLHRLAIPRGDQ